MNRVTRSQFVSTLSNLPFHIQAIRDEAGTVNYYAPWDTDRRELFALREIKTGAAYGAIYYLSAALTEGI